MQDYAMIEINDYNDEMSYLQENIDYYEYPDYKDEEALYQDEEDEYRVFMFQELINEIYSVKEKHKNLSKSVDELLLAIKKFQLEYEKALTEG